MRSAPQSPIRRADVEMRYMSFQGYQVWNLHTTPSTPTQGGTSVSVIRWPEGAGRPWGGERELEYHSLHEEAIILSGSITWNGIPALVGPAYRNHPPFWMHPAHQKANTEAWMLLRSYIPPIVQLWPFPDNWDGTEGFAPEGPTKCTGVSRLQIETVPWQPVLDAEGADTGLRGRHLWDDADDGWVCWMLQAPPGWQGTGVRREVEGGREMFVVEGDLTLDIDGHPTTLTDETYFCEPERYTVGGTADGSEGGCVAYCWTRRGDFTPLRPVDGPTEAAS